MSCNCEPWDGVIKHEKHCSLNLETNPKFEVVMIDDWEVLFKDGKVIEEHHTVPSCMCLPCAIHLAEKHGITSKNLTSREATKKEYDLVYKYGNWEAVPEDEWNKEEDNAI